MKYLFLCGSMFLLSSCITTQQQAMRSQQIESSKQQTECH